MKRISSFLAVLLALALVFAGCKKPEVVDQTVTCGELTLTLPGDYVNLSGEDYAEGLAFVYGHGGEAVLGIQQERSSLMEVFPDMTALDFGQLFADKAGLDVEVEADEETGLVTFLYTADAGGTQVTYLSGVYMTGSSFWVVQFYCPTEDYSARSAAFMRYLAAVQA